MYCQNCGSRLEDNATFCSECGTRTSDDSTTNNVQPQAPAQAAPRPTPQAAPRPTPQPAPQTAPVQRPMQQTTPMPNTGLNAPLGVMSYIGMFILMGIPLVNFVCMLMWMFGSNVNKNKKNFAIAVFIMAIVGIILSFLLSGFFAAILIPLIEDSQFAY